MLPPMLCGVCHSPIVRRYYKNDEVGAICAACFEGLPKCDHCGKALVHPIQDGPRAFCAACFQHVAPCVLCGHRIGRKSWTVQDMGVVCEACWTASARCTACGRPTLHPRGVVGPDGRGKQFCEECWANAERCAACGIPLSGTFWTSEAWPDRKFCDDCHSKRDQCDFCAMPVLQEGFRYPDGRVACATCHATAFEDEGKLPDLDREARGWLQERLAFFLRPPETVPVSLAGADRIAQIVGHAWHPTPGFDGRERGLFSSEVTRILEGAKEVRRDEKLAIYLESGLPQADVYGVMVHELTHLWQFDNYPHDGVDRRWVEGLACWAQYHALREAGHTTEAEWIAINRDPIYGDGFRQVKALEERAGFGGTVAAVLQALRG